MNDIEVSAWHRERAKKLVEQANAKLAEAKAHADMANKLCPIPVDHPDPIEVAVQTHSRPIFLPRQAVTIEKVRSYLEHNGGRVGHVAAHFHVPAEVIQKLIDADDSGVVVKPRGWLKLAETEDQIQKRLAEDFQQPQ